MLEKKVAKNAGWIIGCKIVQSVLALVISMLTARFLGPSNFGLINYAASLVAFVAPLMQLGFSSIIVQELVDNSDKEGEILGTCIFANFITSLFCIVGLGVFVYFVDAGETITLIVCLLYSTLLIAQAFEMIQYWFQAKLISKYTSITMLVAYVVVSAYKIFLLLTNKSVYWFAIAQAFDYLIIAISLLIIYKKLGGQKLSFSFPTLSRLLKKGKYFMISDIMVVIFVQIDRIMIKSILGNEFTGYYSASYACASMSTFVFVAIISSFRPMIFEQKKDNEKYEKSIIMLYSIVIYLSLAQGIIMSIFAEFIIKVLYGAQYLNSIDCLKIIVWQFVFSYIGSVRNIWLLAENKQKYLLIINLIGAVVNVGLNIFLINKLGIEGAAITAIITQFSINVLTGFIIKPIRRNNLFMLKALNPMRLKEMIKSLKK